MKINQLYKELYQFKLTVLMAFVEENETVLYHRIFCVLLLLYDEYVVLRSLYIEAREHHKTYKILSREYLYFQTYRLRTKFVISVLWFYCKQNVIYVKCMDLKKKVYCLFTQTHAYATSHAECCHAFIRLT